jgi:hypothetical protein
LGEGRGEALRRKRDGAAGGDGKHGQAKLEEGLHQRLP